MAVLYQKPFYENDISNGGSCYIFIVDIFMLS